MVSRRAATESKTYDESDDSQRGPEDSERCPCANRRATDFWAAESEHRADACVGQHGYRALRRQDEDR
jgi:hypothetical protein